MDDSRLPPQSIRQYHLPFMSPPLPSPQPSPSSGDKPAPVGSDRCRPCMQRSAALSMPPSPGRVPALTHVAHMSGSASSHSESRHSLLAPAPPLIDSSTRHFLHAHDMPRLIIQMLHPQNTSKRLDRFRERPPQVRRFTELPNGWPIPNRPPPPRARQCLSSPYWTTQPPVGRSTATPHTPLPASSPDDPQPLPDSLTHNTLHPAAARSAPAASWLQWHYCPCQPLPRGAQSPDSARRHGCPPPPPRPQQPHSTSPILPSSHYQPTLIAQPSDRRAFIWYRPIDRNVNMTESHSQDIAPPPYINSTPAVTTSAQPDTREWLPASTLQ
jgi:hypothetical protein